MTEGPAVAAPFLREAANAFAGPDVSVAERLRWAWTATVVGAALWDDRGTCFEVVAGQGLDRLSEWCQAGGTDWGLGVEARCRALLAEGEPADQLYKEAIGRLGRTPMRPELACAHLLYGEWLRRQRRRSGARKQLRVARQMLDEIGMEAFAERARRELRATGESVNRRTLTFQADLTPQESQIARLAADGLSNPEIGTGCSCPRAPSSTT